MLSYLIIAFLIGYILSTKRPPAPLPSRHPKSDTHRDPADPSDPRSGSTGQTAPVSQVQQAIEQLPSLECHVAPTPEDTGITSLTAPDGESETKDSAAVSLQPARVSYALLNHSPARSHRPKAMTTRGSLTPPSTAKYPTIRDGAGRTSASQVLKNEAAGISPRTWITEDGWTTIQGARILLGTGRAELGARLNM